MTASRSCVALFSIVALMARPAPSAAQAPAPASLLVVLEPAGEMRDGLPVLRRHPNAPVYEAVLERGFSGRMLQLFRWEQQFLRKRDGTPLEPAYLLLSNNQGGFPKFGFWLEGVRKSDVGYVDLHQRQPLSGRFGAMDQIFPHELMHVIVRQLAGSPPADASGANQVHAIGVRTDPVVAFDEGFAEHVQVLAVDDADAPPDTHALAGDAALESFVSDRLARYERALAARWAPAPPARMGFVLWFSQSEQVLRYHAVKANAFAHEPSIPPGLLAARDRFPAYLLENVLPGNSDAALKSTPRLFATEAVVSALFSRWVLNSAMQQAASDAALYARFQALPSELTPIDHAYLKLFAVLADHHPHDAASLVRRYVESFPREADAAGALMRDLGFTWPLSPTPEIWLANDAFMTGTTLFDQYRGVPRVHTFDLNAASLVDLLTVEGVSMEPARALQHGAPYAAVTDVARVAGVTPAVVARLEAMSAAMVRVREANARGDEEALSLSQIFMPLVRRAAIVMVIGAVAAAWIYGRVRRARVWRLALVGTAASLLGFGVTWVLGAALQYHGGSVAPAVLAFVPAIVFGVPGSLWQIVRRRSIREAGRVAAAWILACLPTVVMTAAWF